MAQNPFNTNEDAEIREGFICPMCKDDLKDVESLLKHLVRNLRLLKKYFDK